MCKLPYVFCVKETGCYNLAVELHNIKLISCNNYSQTVTKTMYIVPTIFWANRKK